MSEELEIERRQALVKAFNKWTPKSDRSPFRRSCFCESHEVTCVPKNEAMALLETQADRLASTKRQLAALQDRYNGLTSECIDLRAQLAERAEDSERLVDIRERLTFVKGSLDSGFAGDLMDASKHFTQASNFIDELVEELDCRAAAGDGDQSESEGE